MRDLIVDSDRVALAVRDFGGQGRAILLLHGLGRTLLDWSVLAPLLATDGRVVAFDLRGHGKSDDGEWSWPAAVEDIDAVLSTLKLEDPAIVGHSLGGMLAVMWAKDHPTAPVVNVDGHGRRAISQYAGIPAKEAERRVAAANERVKASLGALAGPLPSQLIEGLLAQQRALAVRFGAPEDLFVDSIRRSLRPEDGGTVLRPSPTGLGAQILAAAEEFDMFELYPKISGPVLVISGTEPDPGVDSELMAAYRIGLRRDLEELAADHPNVRIEFVKGGHGLLFENPEELSRRIKAFVRQ